MPPRRSSFLRPLGSLDAERVRAAAPVLFGFNAAAGLIAWSLLYQVSSNSPLLPPSFSAASQSLLWLYLGASVWTCLRYRSGEVVPSAVALDVITSLAALLWVGVATGGVASPATLLAGTKIAISGLMFGGHVGLWAAGCTGIFWASFAVMDRIFGSFAAPAAEMLALQGELAGTYFLAYALTLATFIWLALYLSRNETVSRVEALRARRIAERERQALATTNALLRVSNVLAHLAEPRELLDTALSVARELLQAELGSAFLWNDEAKTYRQVATSDPSGTRKESAENELSAEAARDLEWARSLGHCVLAGSLVGFSEQEPERYAVLLVPLSVENHFHGVLQFARLRDRPFTHYEIRLADGLATQLALALERARLVEQSYRLLRAVESTEEGVLILDRGGRIQFANPAFLHMFGYGWDAIGGRAATDLAEPPAEGWSAVYESLASRQHWRGELQARHANAGLVPVRLHANSIVDPQGSLEGIVAILEDIRAEKELQQQLTRANRLAAAGELAASLAHELNNALAVILGQTTVALSRTVPADPTLLERALTRIDGQAKRMAGLVSDLLGFARPKPPKLQCVRLSDLARTTTELFAPQCRQRQIELRLEDRSRGLEVEADPAQVQQVLMNLLVNALQALPEKPGGRIVVRVSAADRCGMVEVEDNGPGIPAELLPRIFDPFFTTKTSGTGLGLSVSYAIAREHRGNLTVHSRLGEGTTFRLELPVPQTERKLQPAEHAPLAVREVLVVDDDDLVADGLAVMLEREGVHVERAASGEEAIRHCTSGNWDAIFLDLRLPDWNGVEVYRWLGEHRPDLARRVVFVSGGLWHGGFREGRSRLPDQPLLAKPYSREELWSALRSLAQLQDAA